MISLFELIKIVQIIKTLSNLVTGISDIGPVKKLASLARGVLDTVTLGRGLKLWSKPGIKEVKSKDEFSEFELQNGLKVIFKQSKGTEINAKLTIHSGSAKDPKGKEGLAHFLEHIVVSNTKDFGKEVDDVVKLNGGYVNAYTSTTETSYPLVLPKDKLGLALKILRSYMSPLDYEDKTVEKEKGIVCSEIKMTEANPVRIVYNKFQEMLLGEKHPLAKPVIGTSKAVNGLTKTDLEKFLSTEYVPNNTTITFSGDFEKHKLKSLVTKYFSDLQAREETKIPDFSTTVKASLQRDHELKDDSLISGLKFAFKTEKFNHKDELVASLITEALSSGEDSRLSRKLVDGEANNGKAVALAVSSYDSTNKDYGHYIVSAKPIDENQEQNLKIIEKVVQDELDDIAKNGLKEREFERVVKKLEADEIYKKDYQHSDLGTVASYKEEGEDWTKALNRLEDLKSITQDDIKNFVQKYLNRSNRHSLKIIGKGSSLNNGFLKSLQDKIPDKIDMSSEELNLTAEKLDKILTLSGGASNISARLDNLQKIQAENGMQVFFKEDHSLPLVIVDANFEGGSLAIDSELEPSLAMLNALLSETGSYNPRTKRRLDKKDIENMSINLGAGFHQGTGSDHGTVHFSSLAKNTDKTLALMNEVLNNPALLEENNSAIVKNVQEEFDRQKKSTIDMLKVFEKFPEMKASEEFSRAIYPEGHKCHQRSIAESIKKLEAVKLEDMRELYKKLYHAKGAKLTVVGDISREAINEKIIPFLDSWNKEYQVSERKPDYSRIGPVEAKPVSIKVVTSDDNKPESTVIIGNPAEIIKDTPDYFPAILANTVLGSGMSSRLFNEVREKRGLAYHVGSSLTSFRKGSGPFSISLGCDPRNVKKSIAAVISTVKSFLNKGVNKEELELAKSELKKSFALGAFNSRSASCGTLAGLQLRDKDENFVNNFNNMIDTISLEEVNAAAHKFIKPGNFTIVATKPKDFKFENVKLVTKETAKKARASEPVLAA